MSSHVRLSVGVHTPLPHHRSLRTLATLFPKAERYNRWRWYIRCLRRSRALKKLDYDKFNLILIAPRPHYVRLPATARMVVMGDEKFVETGAFPF